MKKLCIALLITSVATLSYGDLLAGWDMAGLAGNEASVNAQTTGTSVDTCTLSRGAGLVADTGANYFDSVSWSTGTAVTDAQSGNNYLSMSLAATAGNTLSITNISWNMNRTSTSASDYTLRSSADGFTADLYTWNPMDTATGGGDIDDVAVSVSGAAVEFRLYGWNASSTAGSTRFRNLSGDDIEFMGTVAAVPEPTTVGLLTLGLAGLLVYRKRRS
jgi:hypothetical protein